MMKMRIAVHLSLAVCAVSAAPSFGAGPTASGADPCALIDKAAMAALFGELKEGPKPDTGLRQERECGYTNMAGSWLKLSVYGKDRWGWEKGMANEPRDIAGLGDEAFVTKRGTDSVVYVRKGESILEVSCSCSREEAEKVARKAAPKI
jgi:hypothetical protein